MSESPTKRSQPKLATRRHTDWALSQEGLQDEHAGTNTLQLRPASIACWSSAQADKSSLSRLKHCASAHEVFDAFDAQADACIEQKIAAQHEL